jgi:hypothetical protein
MEHLVAALTALVLPGLVLAGLGQAPLALRRASAARRMLQPQQRRLDNKVSVSVAASSFHH